VRKQHTCGMADGAGGKGRRPTVESHEIATVLKSLNTRAKFYAKGVMFRRLSVAVLVNGIYNVPDGSDVIYAMNALRRRLARLSELVPDGSRVGNTRAGIVFSVDSMRFMDYFDDSGRTRSIKTIR